MVSRYRGDCTQLDEIDFERRGYRELAGGGEIRRAGLLVRSVELLRDELGLVEQLQEGLLWGWPEGEGAGPRGEAVSGSLRRREGRSRRALVSRHRQTCSA